MALPRDVTITSRFSNLKKHLQNSIKSSASELLENINTVSGLWRLIFQTEGYEVYYKLNKMGFSPTADELNEADPLNNRNAWSYLISFRDGKGINVFKELIDSGVLPSQQALETNCGIQYPNTWYGLACLENDCGIFQELLAKGIQPSCQALEVCHAEYHINTWYVFAFLKKITLLLDLFDRDILPSQDALELCHVTDNTNTWHKLACDELIHIFQALLDNGISPSRQALDNSNVFNGASAWDRLASSDKCFPVFSALFEKGIFPPMRFLREFRKYADHSALVWPKVYTNQIFLPLENLNNLSKSLEIENAHTNPVAILLSKKDIDKVYEYLCFLYLMTEKNIETIPRDLLDLIGVYCFLPLWVNHKMLLTEECRNTFIKFHMNCSITEYENGFFNTSIFGSNRENVKRVKNEILKSDKPSTILKKEYFSNQSTFFNKGMVDLFRDGYWLGSHVEGKPQLPPRKTPR